MMEEMRKNQNDVIIRVRQDNVNIIISPNPDATIIEDIVLNGIYHSINPGREHRSHRTMQFHNPRIDVHSKVKTRHVFIFNTRR